MNLQAELHRRRRGVLLILLPALLGMILITGKFTHFLLTGGRFDFSREWAAVLMLIPPLAALILLLRKHLRHRARHAAHGNSIRETLRALLDENRLARNRLKTIAVLHAVVLPLVPLVARQLRGAGKAGDEILLPAFVLYPVLVLFILTAMLRHYRRALLPREQELAAMLRACEEDGGAPRPASGQWG